MKFQAAIAAVVVLAASAASAYAQAAVDRPVRRIEADAGAGILGGGGLGSADANLRRNDPVRQTFRLFATSSDVGRAPLWLVRLAFPLSQRFAIEGALTKATTDLRVSATSDFEGAPSITTTETIDQYFFEASVLVMLDELRIGTRAVPFAAAGGGYLRQLHEGQRLVEEGEVYHAGGGIKYWLMTRKAGAVRSAGLRADARAYFLRGGISFDDRPRSHVAISGSVFVGF
jgi:hypothetical protein